MLLLSGALYINQGRKKEIFYEKILMYGFAIFWIFVASARIFFYFSESLLDGLYTGDLNAIIDTYNIDAYVVLYFNLYFFHYLFIHFIMLNIMFIWFSFKSKGEFQAVSSIVTIGFALLLIGWAFEIHNVKVLNVVYPPIPSLFIILGTLFVILPLILDIEFISSRLANIIVIFSFIGIGVFLSLTLFTNLPLFIISQLIIWISVILLLIVIIYIVMSIIKQKKGPITQTSIVREELKDFIKIFTKPSTITIEEVELYREKGICLVCKSKISRLNYSCPKCNALYCIKCSEALTSLENACWVCETPFDDSKPVKISKK